MVLLLAASMASLFPISARAQSPLQQVGGNQPQGGFAAPQQQQSAPGAASPAQQTGQGGFGRQPNQQAAPNTQRLGEQLQPATPLPKVPDKLEDMLTLALRSNPEILLAESKLRQAQSELNQVRLKVTEEVVKLYYERNKEEELLAQLTQRLELVRALFEQGARQIRNEDVIAATIARSTAAAAVPQIEAQTRYLLGLGGDTPASLPVVQSAPQSQTAPTAPRPEIPEKFREILGRPANFPFEDTPLEQACQFLEEDHNVAIFVDAAAAAEFGPDVPVTFKATNLPLGQAFQAMLDSGFSDPGGSYRMCFVFREYGILVTTPIRAERLYGATIPPEIPMLRSALPPGVTP